ncbi:hypothetical protein AmDm5_0269 [Acetobacter malorum]|nr:hypothetical protein AmDm5_0269 [Acetobacter malorum]
MRYGNKSMHTGVFYKKFKCPTFSGHPLQACQTNLQHTQKSS